METKLKYLINLVAPEGEKLSLEALEFLEQFEINTSTFSPKATIVIEKLPFFTTEEEIKDEEEKTKDSQYVLFAIPKNGEGMVQVIKRWKIFPEKYTIPLSLFAPNSLLSIELWEED